MTSSLLPSMGQCPEREGLRVPVPTCRASGQHATKAMAASHGAEAEAEDKSESEGEGDEVAAEAEARAHKLAYRMQRL